jgi:CRISPR-associated protein Csx10
MPRFDVIVGALEPLLLGGGQATGNVQTSLPYVAGSVWRGATAGAVLKGQAKYLHSGRPISDPAPDPAFAEVFLGETATRFGFLYPVRECVDTAGVAEALPIPLTARTCKQHPGFAPHGHGVFDGLMYRLRQKAGAVTEGAGLPACPVCKQRLERLRGFMRRTTEASAGYRQMKVGTRSFVRVGLNRYTETAQDQVLYVLDALVPGDGSQNSEQPISFLGSWWGSRAQRQQLADLLDQHLLPEQDGYGLALGAARARGMGRSWLRIVDPTSASKQAASLEQRIYLAQPQLAGRQLDPHYSYATLTLRAPLLLLDAHGLPAQQVTSDILRAYHAAAPPDLHVLHDISVIEREPAAGWSSAWGLPKPLLPAISAGSVLALCAPAAQRDQMVTYLAELEEGGLGERVAEGWGEVLVCDPFHASHDAAR